MEFEFCVEDRVGDALRIDSFVYKAPGHARASEHFEVSTSGVPWLTRAQMHELHAAIGQALGMASPSPTAPMTASHPASGGAKASRNLRLVPCEHPDE